MILLGGTVSHSFCYKTFELENRKLNIDYIDLESFYVKNNEIKDQDLINFINENSDQLKVEHIDFKYALINPQILIV